MINQEIKTLKFMVTTTTYQIRPGIHIVRQEFHTCSPTGPHREDKCLKQLGIRQ